jgi:hypothetical protein
MNDGVVAKDLRRKWTLNFNIKKRDNKLIKGIK